MQLIERNTSHPKNSLVHDDSLKNLILNHIYTHTHTHIYIYELGHQLIYFIIDFKKGQKESRMPFLYEVYFRVTK